MGLLIECPECKKRNNLKVKNCTGKIKDGTFCRFALSKYSGKVYWIEYYDQNKKLRRERIGPNKAAAEQRYREVLSKRAEGRCIKKSPENRTLFKDLAKWYLDLPEIKNKRSYSRDERSVGKLLPFFGDLLLRDIKPVKVEAYKQKRLNEISYRGHQTKPATVNRELACLKTIFNKAIANDKAERNPVKGVKLEKENNIRDKVLSFKEYEALLAQCPTYLKPIVQLAYHTGMRKGEILTLCWEQVYLKEGVIRLKPENTKTNEGRSVYLDREMVEMFRAMPRSLPGVRVFTRNSKPISCIREAFERACRRAGIKDFTFHDLRHTFVTNWRKAGIHESVIMKQTGHKTRSMFDRYNAVTDEERKAVVENIHLYIHQDNLEEQKDVSPGG